MAVVMPGLPFVPEPSEFSARVDASPIYTALYLPQTIKQASVLSASANASPLAKISNLSETNSGYLYAKEGIVAEVLVKSGEIWDAESEFLDSSEM